MRVHLINPSDLSFGVGVITPRWLFTLAAATPAVYGDPLLTDEMVEPVDFGRIAPGDVVGIGIHTLNCLRGYEVGRRAREKGAKVVFGGIHASLFPAEAAEYGGAASVVRGDGDVVWSEVLADCANGGPRPLYEGGRVEADQLSPARWDLIGRDRYMWASVQTVRGCPKHCSFCSVWRTDGQRPRQRPYDAVIQEMVELRRLGFRFIVLADDNFYPVTLGDLKKAERQGDRARIETLKRIREDRFELMARMAKLPRDMVFFTQITTEAAEDPDYLDAMREARIRGALVGVESVTPEGLKAVYKDFSSAGEELIEKLRTFRRHGVYVLGSFIFGLRSDSRGTFDLTLELAQQAEIAFAQFVTLTPLPGTLDFEAWEKEMANDPTRFAGQPITRFWLIPPGQRPKAYIPHPELSREDIRAGTQRVWDRFYGLRSVWRRSGIVRSLRARLAFILISKLYRQMYANTGLATDSARSRHASVWARRIARPCRRLFHSAPMPDLEVPLAAER